MANKFALCVGINNYPGTDNDLSGCVNDVADWTAELERRGFKVESLIDKEATNKAITGTLRKVIDNAAARDSVVFQYSGHGSYIADDESNEEADGTDECLCPYDMDKYGLIRDDELYDVMDVARIKQVKVVMISDSCHSGSVTRFASGGIADRSNRQRRVRFLPPENFLKPEEVNKLAKLKVFSRSARVVTNAGLLMAGCKDAEYSYDATFEDRPNGAFTFVALQTLKEMGAKSTYKEWHQRIRKYLPTQEYPQTPILFGPPLNKKWVIFE